MMSAFSLARSVGRAQRRLSAEGKRSRSDRGRSRWAAPIDDKLAELLGGRERPAMTNVHRELVAFCEGRSLEAPSRSSLYNAVERVAVPKVQWDDLPDEVRRCLFNLDRPDGGSLPGDVVAFYAFNHGHGRALSYGAGLPWLCLVRAAQRTGWRPKSRALLEAVMRYRGLS